ncbi:aspartate--tRNA ligase [Sesbania bispinosa]|nr:aspartate--tRNA ligase [Sesbania bispinosa]
MSQVVASEFCTTNVKDIRGGAYPVGDANIISPTNSGPIEVTGAADISQNISEPIEVTAPNDENEKQEKESYYILVDLFSQEKKKDVATKKKPKQKVTVTPTYYHPVKPRQFIGFYI